MDKELKQMVAQEIAGMAVTATLAQGGVLSAPLPQYVGEDVSEQVITKNDFDRILAMEMAKAEPQPPRMTEPFDLAQAIASRAELPAGSGAEHPEAGSFRFLADGGEDIDYLYSVKVSARYQAEIEEAVNAMIQAGQGNFRHDGVEIYLHAVSGFRAVSRVPGKEAFATTLNYIFRVRPIEAGPARR